MLLWQVVLTALSAAVVPPSSSDLPLSIQIPAFLKALDFDRNLKVDESSFVVTIVYDPNNPSSVADKDRVLAIQGQLTRLLVRGKRVVLEERPYQEGSPITVTGVLISTGLERMAVEELSQRAQSAGTLTLTTDPTDVEHGLVLGVESAKGRPRFVINLAAAKATGVSFEARFLNLCRVVEN